MLEVSQWQIHSAFRSFHLLGWSDSSDGEVPAASVGAGEKGLRGTDPAEGVVGAGAAPGVAGAAVAACAGGEGGVGLAGGLDLA